MLTIAQNAQSATLFFAVVAYIAPYWLRVVFLCNVPSTSKTLLFSYLFVCPKYNHQRSILIKELHVQQLNVKFTLQILFDPRATLNLSTFLKTSGEVI